MAVLLSQILSEPAFDILRTKEQLGYIVSASRWTAPGHNDTGLRIVVQSERGPVYLEGRVEAFLDHMKGVIELMTDEEFAEQKHGLERKWREVAKNLEEEVSRFYVHIDSGYLDFLRRKRPPSVVVYGSMLKTPHRCRRYRVFDDSYQGRRTVVVPYPRSSVLQDSIQVVDPRTITEATTKSCQPCGR